MNPSAAISQSVLQKNSDRFFLVVILVLVFIMAARTPLDSDMWWHLRAGEEIWRTGRPLLVDLFSYTRLGASWTNVHWLAQVGMYLLYRWGGLTLIGGMVACLAAASLYTLTLQMECPVLFKAFLLILASLVSAPVWVARPQIISLVLLGIVGYLLYLYKWRQKDRLWVMVILFALWANLHPYYVLGLLFIAGMIAGEILNHFLGHEGIEILSWKRIIRLSLWGIASGIAILANPTGIKAWLLPFQTIGINVLQNYINEWASPDFHQLVQQPFIWMLLLTMAAVGLSQRRLDGTDLVTFSGFAYLALVARRNFGPFAIAAAPVLCRYLWTAINLWVVRIKPVWNSILDQFHISPEQLSGLSNYNLVRSKIINLGVFAFLVVVAVGKLYFATYPQVVKTYEDAMFPTKALAWIEANHPAGRMFNSYSWGGYLLWSESNYPVFLDGRTDIYSDAIVGQWLTVVDAKDGWQKVLDQWDVHLILLEPDWPIDKVLPLSGWEILYKDNVAVVFGR